MLILALLMAFTLYADAHALTVTGKASVFGNDPVQGFIDPGDSGVTALGTPTARGGIAVYRQSTLGGWWRVCPPPRFKKHCHFLKQTDVGPAPYTSRVLDVTAVAARRAWGWSVYRFPTDVGIWRLTYHGRRNK